MLRFLALLALIEAGATTIAGSASANCPSVTSGATADKYGWFFPDATPDDGMWIKPGDKASGAGKFCRFSASDWNRVTVGDNQLAASSINPVLTGIGKASASLENGGFIASVTSNIAAVCSLTTYTSDPNQLETINASSPLSFSYNQQAAQTISGQSGCEYAVAQAALSVGTSTMGGTVGVALYGSTGSGTCSTNVNGFQPPQSNGCGAIGETAYTNGKCNGEEVKMCIGAEGTGLPNSEAACSTRSFPAGSIKYAIFLTTSGSSFDWTNKCSAPATPTHIGVRQTFYIGSYGGSTPLMVNSSTVTFNNGVLASSIGSTSISKVKIGDLEATFPTSYTYGTYSSSGYSTVGRGTITIKYAKLGDQTFALDFFFDKSHLDAANKWAAYDPDVKCTTNCGGSSSAMTAQASVSFAVLAAIAAMWSF